VKAGVSKKEETIYI